MEIISLFEATNTTSSLLNLALVSILGIAIGKISIGKIRLGIAGVLFSGLLIGHLGAEFDHHVLHFVKEFGLILFVYSIGIEIGPRFLASFKSNGIKLNMLATAIIVSGVLITLAIKIIFNLDTEVAIGMLCGGVTNTPSLGAAQSLISEQMENGSVLAETTGMAYAIAYPFGIVGIILVMLLIRNFFKIKLEQEIDQYKDSVDTTSKKAQTIAITVSNPNINGKSITFIKDSLDHEFVFSRISRNGTFLIPEKDQIVEKGDVIYGLASEESFSRIELTIGKFKITEKVEHSGPMAMRHIMITNRKIANRTLKDISISNLFPATITRIFRGETEIIPSSSSTLEFGDTVRVVGARDKMDEVAKFLGNSLRDLSHPNLLPLFTGILLGVLVGSIPFFIPGLPAPAKLGLAGGPLIIALILGHKGRIGKFDFYMTPGANKYIRELGIVLFLACVGLGAGKHFWETLVNGGLQMMGLAAIITFVPLFLVGVIARMMKINYLTICGLLAGSMTDPPALEFANSIAPVQAQANAYAMVYPLTMFLRILLAQIFILIFV